MVQSIVDNNKTDIHGRLVELIQGNVSSVEFISEELGLTEEETGTILTELILDGTIKGSLTEDGSRFFRSDTKKSTLPQGVIEQDYELKYPDTRLGKIVTIVGLAMFIVGQFFPNATWGAGDTLADIGSSIVIFGLAVFIGGLFLISRQSRV